MSVPAQIAVLLALTADLFDPVALDQMADAEHVVQKAAANMPAEVCRQFESADKLSDEDRNAIIEIARQALTPFQSKPDAKADQKPEPASKAEAKPKSKPESQPKGKAGPDRGAKPDAPTKPTAAAEDKL